MTKTAQSAYWPDDTVAASWRDKMQAAWPHVRSALLRRTQEGPELTDLAGVVTEGGRESSKDGQLTVGVLTRAELAETIRENGDSQLLSWTDLLDEPAPSGCIYVFGSFSGVPGLCTMAFVGPLTN